MPTLLIILYLILFILASVLYILLRNAYTTIRDLKEQNFIAEARVKYYKTRLLKEKNIDPESKGFDYERNNRNNRTV